MGSVTDKRWPQALTGEGDTARARVYIALGSNLDRPYVQIKRAIDALAALEETRVLADSGYFKSKPMGPSDQPDYVNAVVEMETGLPPQQLLQCCQQIEQQQGRVKKRHWGERSIDLDILLYAQQQVQEDNLTIPHPGICERDFVYMPLLKLAPSIHIPGRGPLQELVANAGASDNSYDCLFSGNIQ